MSISGILNTTFMKLNSATDFSFRFLIYASVHGDRLVTVAEVAEAYGLSHHHLSKICKTLIKEGILEAKRGRDGGVKLALPPEELKLSRVIQIMEPDPALVNCTGGIGGRCKILPACKLKGVLAEARRAFFEVLDKYTLADLVAEPALARELTTLLR